MREQCLNGELFYTLKEAQIVTERWRTHDNTIRAQQSRGPATRPRNRPACELRTHRVGGTKTPGWSLNWVVNDNLIFAFSWIHDLYDHYRMPSDYFYLNTYITFK
jgi:hypothetical protein